MDEFGEFCESLGIEKDRAREVISRERSEFTSELATPWYVRLVVGVGAWVTAIAAIALGVAIVELIGSESVESLLIVLGIAYVGVGLWLLRQAAGAVFATQLGTALAAAGAALFTTGVFIESYQPWPAFLASAAATAVMIFAARNRTLEFLVALLTVLFFIFAILDPVDNTRIPYYRDIIALTGVAGAALTLWPPKRDFKAVAIVLLLAFPIFDWFSVDVSRWLFRNDPVAPGGLIAKLLYIGCFLWLAMTHWQRVTTAELRTRLIVFGAAAILVGLLLPAGGSAALMIMMLAFVLGSRPLALLGSLLQINYLWRFYYNMEMTLLAKSAILAAVGVVLVLAWWLMTHYSSKAVRA